ncbi:MAG: UDP-glucose--hexose-1-phosphate uridylyltransferase [Clostridiales bacterium]|nr:UDP-glucose--hexose-1-phosphate uridylyltransferase [Clostridiales bacterium]
MIEAFVLGTEQVLGKGSCHVLSIRPVGGTVLLGIPPVEQRVCQLVEHALKHGLITGTDRLWAENSIISILKRDCYTRPEQCDEEPVADVLNALIQYARDNGIIEDDNEAADRFDTMLAGILTPRPDEVVRRFRSLYEEEPGRATGWFYEFCQQVNYIRSDRIARDVKWVTETEYGPVDITINLSKPEKDPKAIAAALNQKASGYPACQLCIENEGYAGRPGHPARQNLRLIPVVLDHEQWYFQYSPYSYYNEHCIVLNGEHTPMRINRSTFRKLLDFVKKFPEYFIGSNADLPIVGGSILTHDHFQGGRYTFAMERAPVETEIVIPGYEEVRAGIVKWPMSVIRLTCEDDLKLEVLAEHILESWKAYSDEDCGILSETCGVPHNTVTPIARRQGKSFQLDLVLRNNRTTAEHPYGLFHPHEELHHIKKENIGLIEVMGLAVLPARLKLELSAIARGISAGDDPAANPLTQSHAEWVRDICSRYPNLKADDIEAILKEETGRVFVKVMEHSGVYKCDETGKTAFLRFVSQL